MEAFKENIVDGIIYTFHFQRLTAAAAHSKINEMIGADTCTLQYVEGLYQRIENKKFSLKKPHLFDLPEHFLKNVVGSLDVKSRAIVRKSCKVFRALVDNQPLRLGNLRIFFHQTPTGTSLHFDGLAVTYIEKEDGCLVECSGGRERCINGEMKQLVLNDLKSIFINPKLEIGKLAIGKTKYNRFRPTFREFALMLSSLEHKLHVEHFRWEVYFKTKYLVKIFDAMKPTTLRSLTSNIVEYEIMSTRLNEQIFNLPQWKGVKKLDCTCIIFPEDFIHLAHIDKVVLTKVNYTEQEEVTGEIIAAMKNQLLENEHFNQLIIRDCPGSIPIENLETILRPFQSPTDPCWAQFDHSNSDKKLLLRVYMQHYWFKGPCYEHDKDDLRMIGLLAFDDSEDESEDDSGDENEDVIEEDSEDDSEDESEDDSEEDSEDDSEDESEDMEFSEEDAEDSLDMSGPED